MTEVVVYNNYQSRYNTAMAYVLYDRNETGAPYVIKRYDTRKGAMIGMRASNRNAGWTRVSVCLSGITYMEWARHDGQNDPVYDYAPYVIAEEACFEEQYKLNELVPVVNLMSGKTVMIPRKDRGTCVDPSREVYWAY